MTDTLATLSLPDQQLNAEYFSRVLAFSQKSVIAAPCGWGKTRGVAAYIAQQWREGVLYVAERKDQLNNMKVLLVEHHGIDPALIGLYYGGTEDLESLEQEGDFKPIALVTHARMTSYSPDDYVHFERRGALAPRQLLICDESVVPLQILRVPYYFLRGILDDMKLKWNDIGYLSTDEIDLGISKIKKRLAAHAHKKFSEVGIHYLEWTELLPDFDKPGKTGAERAARIRRHAYYLMLYQLLLGKYHLQNDEVTVLIPMAPHLSWFALVPQILVLDATAHITDYLYDGYTR